MGGVVTTKLVPNVLWVWSRNAGLWGSTLFNHFITMGFNPFNSCMQKTAKVARKVELSIYREAKKQSKISNEAFWLVSSLWKARGAS